MPLPFILPGPASSIWPVTNLVGTPSVLSQGWGPELIANPGPFANTTGITRINATLSVSGGVLTITATGSNSGRAEWSLSGLTIGRGYRAIIRARRSVGTGQRIQSWTWATVPTTALTDSFANYVFYLTATATNGVLRLYASAVGISNDAMEVESVSVR